MNRSKARKILYDFVQPDNSLHNLGPYINWDVGDNCATLDGHFGLTELEAIVWWMRNTKEGEGDGS